MNIDPSFHMQANFMIIEWLLPLWLTITYQKAKSFNINLNFASLIKLSTILMGRL